MWMYAGNINNGVQLVIHVLLSCAAFQTSYGTCDVGYFMKESECLPCPTGMYQDKSNMTYCENCPVYAITTKEGSQTRQDCVVDQPVGCVDVNSSLVLNNWTYTIDVNNTIEDCLTYCSQDGYFFAGYSFEDSPTCYCGNLLPNDTVENVSNSLFIMSSAVSRCEHTSLLLLYKTTVRSAVIFNGNGVMLDAADFGLDLKGRRGIEFKVRTCDNAILKFFNSSDSSKHVKVIIGGGDGVFWSIGDEGYSYRFFTKDTNIVSCTKFLPFWIDWVDNLVRVGRGNEISHEEVGSYQFGSDYKFNVLQLASFSGQEQCWKFITAHDGANSDGRCAEMVDDTSTTTADISTSLASFQSTINLNIESNYGKTSFVTRIHSSRIEMDSSDYDFIEASATYSSNVKTPVFLTTTIGDSSSNSITPTHVTDSVTSLKSTHFEKASEMSFSVTPSPVVSLEETVDPLSNVYVTTTVWQEQSSVVTYDSTSPILKMSEKVTHVDTSILSSFTTGVDSRLSSVADSTVSSTTDGSVVFCVTKYSNTSKEELEAIAMFIKNELAIDKKETSIYKRKHISAWDTRLSAQIIGTTFGPALLMAVFIIIVIIDSSNLRRMLRNIKGRVCGSSKTGRRQIESFRNDKMLKYLHSDFYQ